jgi:hypothetical protein
MSDISWWERRLGGVVNRQQQPPPPPAPTSYGPAVRWEPQYPPTGPRQEVDYGQPGGNGDTTHGQVQRQGYVNKAPSSIGKVGQCPGCGGSNYFRRRWAHTEAAPLCTDCGFNGDLFTQSGTLLNAVGMSSSGPVAFARTDNPGGQSHFEADPSVPGDFSWSSVR